MGNQIEFIELCKERAGESRFAVELADLLGVNVDAAYRRMRGATALTFEEIRKMCLHYNVSFDSAISYQGKLIPFQFNAMFHQDFSIETYLKDIDEQMKSLAALNSGRFVITAMDLPYFTQFGYKGLSRFKLFFWQRSVLNLNSHSNKQFDIDQEEPDYDRITQSIYENYHKVSSTEIWTPETVDSSIKQIQYYLESGLFTTPEVAVQLCEELHQLLSKVEKETEVGRKLLQTAQGTYSARFELFQSDIYLSNNSIQAYKDDQVFTYISFNSFNSLMSFAPRFSNECHQWIEQIRTKSILLSEVSEKLRFQYFQGLRRKVDGLMAMAKGY